MTTENYKHTVCISVSEAPTFAAMESLKERRDRRGLTQKELAGICGCDHSHISHIESGHTDPSLDIFVKMIGALQVTAAIGLEMLRMRRTRPTNSVTDLQKERERRNHR